MNFIVVGNLCVKLLQDRFRHGGGALVKNVTMKSRFCDLDLYACQISAQSDSFVFFAAGTNLHGHPVTCSLFSLQSLGKLKSLKPNNFYVFRPIGLKIEMWVHHEG